MGIIFPKIKRDRVKTGCFSRLDNILLDNVMSRTNETENCKKTSVKYLELVTVENCNQGYAFLKGLSI